MTREETQDDGETSSVASKMAKWSEIGETEEGIELDLSLSLGPSFIRSGRPTSMAEESGLPLREIRRCDSAMSDAENGSSVTDGIQSLGRKDSKRKQRENRRKREIAGVEGLDSGAEGKEKNEERRSKKEKKQKIGGIVDLNLSNQSFLPCKLFSITPMQYSYPPVQYLPGAHTNGFAFPCVMPWWGPGSGAGSFKPYQVNQSGECKFDNGATEKSSDESLTCSSSVVVDNQSCSNEGLGSRSRSCKSLPNLESNGSTANDDSINHMDHAASSRPQDDHDVAESLDKDAIPGNRKVLKSSTKIKNEKFLKPRTHIDDSPSLSSMPCVSAMGDGPDSKRITGFLYRYTKSEVRIVCICHGKSFSPAEFVKHAGGKEESNPLRQITVSPFEFA